MEATTMPLTPREIEVARLTCEDLPDKIIADRLNVSIHTVAAHRSNIEHKIPCHSKAGIVAYAYKTHLK